jgi:hypothetical protein
MSGDPFRINPAKISEPYIPAKIRKRREQLVMVPMAWVEKLGKGRLATGATHQVALYLLHMHWKNHSKPFKLPNGMLEYDGVSRQSKWRALATLERRKLITVEGRKRRSPIVHVIVDNVSQP